MAKLTLSEAARACGIARTTIQRAVKAGRLSLDAEHQVDTAELLRVGYHVDAALLHAASLHGPAAMQQNAALPRSPAATADSTAQEIALLRLERDLLQQERTRLVQQVDLLLTLHQTTQQHLTQAQQMVQQMQHRYDRLLDVGRSPVPAPAASPSPSTSPPRGAMRQQIVALVRDHPEGLSPAETRRRLGSDKDLGSTMKAMARDGLLRRVTTGWYVAAEAFR